MSGILQRSSIFCDAGAHFSHYQIANFIHISCTFGERLQRIPVGMLLSVVDVGVPGLNARLSPSQKARLRTDFLCILPEVARHPFVDACSCRRHLFDLGAFLSPDQTAPFCSVFGHDLLEMEAHPCSNAPGGWRYVHFLRTHAHRPLPGLVVPSIGLSGSSPQSPCASASFPWDSFCASTTAPAHSWLGKAGTESAAI